LRNNSLRATSHSAGDTTFEALLMFSVAIVISPLLSLFQTIFSPRFVGNAAALLQALSDYPWK
jgi:hypothetical protein